MSSRDNFKKFGLAEGPMGASRVLVKRMTHNFGGKEAHSLLIISEKEGTFTAANIYGGNLGERYDPSAYTHPLPAPGSDKWKEWKAKGYEEGSMSGREHYHSVLLDLTETDKEEDTEKEDTEKEDN